MLNRRTLQLIEKNQSRILFASLIQWFTLLVNIGIIAVISFLFSFISSLQFDAFFVGFLFLGFFLLMIRLFLIQYHGKILVKIATQTKTTLRRQFYTKLTQISQTQVNQYGKAELTQVAMEGIEQLELYYSVFLPQMLFGLLAPITVFFIIAPFSLPMAIILLASVPLIPILIIFANRQAKKKLPIYWKSYTNLGDHFFDQIQGISTLKQYLADDQAHKTLNRQAEDFRISTMKVLKMQLNSITIMDLVAYGGAALAILVGVLHLTTVSVNPFLVIFLVLVSAEFFLPLRSLGSAFHIATNGMMALRKIFAILDLPQRKEHSHSINSIVPIQLDQVSFSYLPDREVLKSISLVFPSKGLVVITGQSGSGKSTLGALLSKTYLPSQGSITFHETSVQSLSSVDIMVKMAILNSDNYCFKGSLRDHFYLAKPDATDAEIIHVMNQVQLHKFLQSHAEGLDYALTEGGNNLSVGERQRLFIARTLLQSVQVYLFDEVTSSVDRENEFIIMNVIREIAKNHLVILITHRLKQAISADLVVFMKKGEVIGKGTHTELTQTIKEYQELVHTQAQLESIFEKGLGHEFI